MAICSRISSRSNAALLADVEEEPPVVAPVSTDCRVTITRTLAAWSTSAMWHSQQLPDSTTFKMIDDHSVRRY